MELYFRDSYDSLRFVKTIERDNAMSEIAKYIHKLNSEYKIPYYRIYTTPEGVTVFDVGSHSEFFELRPEKIEEG